MSPSTATASRRGRPGGSASGRGRRPARRAAVRRRRSVLTLVAVMVAVGAVFLAMPLFRKAVSEFTLPLSYADVIREQAADKHLDPALIAAVIYAETKFDPRTSAAGAVGLMQILPQTAEFLARRSGATTFRTSDLATPGVNIAYGSYYLRYLLNHYGGRTMLGLAAYNAGEANVDGWVAASRQRGRPLTISGIPFSETRDYVIRVLDAQRRYRRTYATELGYR
jgi:soluble lytic murein transglycosylase